MCMYLKKEKGSEEDVYKDIFIEERKKVGVIRYEDNPKSYLLSVAIRLWKNRVRKFAWRNRIAPQVGETALEQEGGATPDVSEKAVANEERGMLWKAVDALDDRYRIPLLLYYMEEQSIAELAELLSIPQGTVKSRLHKARQLLEKELEDYYS